MYRYIFLLKNFVCKGLKVIKPVISLWDLFSFSEFGEVLKAYCWPFIVSTVKPTAQVANVAEVKGQLGALFNNLLKLQLPYPNDTMIGCEL